MAKDDGTRIDSVLAGKLMSGWQKELLVNGRVTTEGGAHLLRIKDICQVIQVNGSVMFYCDTGRSSAEFVQTLKEQKKPPMSCETHHVPGCQQVGCEIWLRQ